MSRASAVGRQEWLGGTVFLILGIVVVLASSENDWVTTSGVVGPAAVPGTCGILLAAIGLVQVGQGVLARRAAPVEAGGATPTSAATPSDDADASVEPVESRRYLAWLGWAGVIVAAVALPYLGMLPVIGLLTVYLLKVVSRKTWRAALLYAVCLVVAVQLLFVIILGIPLPTSPWIG